MAELLAQVFVMLVLEFLKAIIWVATASAFYFMIKGEE